MTPETLKSTCIMFRTELEHKGASMGIMSVFDSMCSYLGEESRELNRALVALEESQQQKEMDDKIISVLDGCISRFEGKLAEAQQTISILSNYLKELRDVTNSEIIESQITNVLTEATGNKEGNDNS